MRPQLSNSDPDPDAIAIDLKGVARDVLIALTVALGLYLALSAP